MQWLSGAAQRIFEFLSAPRLLIAIFLFSLALVILPIPIIRWFGLTDIVNAGRGIFSLLLILSTAGLLSHGLIHGARAVQDRRAERTQVREAEAAAKQKISAREHLVERAIDRLDSLSDEEIDWLAAAVRDRQQTIFTHLHEPVASSLVDKGFLKLGSAGVALSYPYHFHDDIWEALVENQDLILEEQRRRKSRR